MMMMMILMIDIDDADDADDEGVKLCMRCGVCTVWCALCGVRPSQEKKLQNARGGVENQGVQQASAHAEVDFDQHRRIAKDQVNNYLLMIMSSGGVSSSQQSQRLVL